MKLSLKQLSERSQVPGRTVRYYIQKGLLPAPRGRNRGAWYTETHLATLLRIRQWQEAGLSLEAIADLLNARTEPPLAPARPGSVDVRSHLVVADGVELVVSPDRARLTQSDLRRLFLAVQESLDQILSQTAAEEETPAPGLDATPDPDLDE